MKDLDDLLNEIKEQLDPHFDTEAGREMLEDLAEWISTNLDDI